GRRPFFHRNGRTFARFLDTLHDDSVAGLQSIGYFPQRADALAHFHRTNAAFVVLIDNGDLIAALQFVHGFLRNNHRTFFHVSDEPDLSELSWPQIVSRIRKRHIVADRSRLRIKVAIERVEFSFARIDLAVAEDQLEVEALYVRLALRRIVMARNEIGPRPFANGHHGFDRINLRHGCEWSRTWPD